MREFRAIPKFNHEKFLSKIRVSGECWEWQGGVRDNGYAIMWVDDMDYQAQRLSYDLFSGIKDKSKVIDHICMNKKCVNPEHLREVTEKVNALENSFSPGALNKRKTHCKRGHELSEENGMYQYTNYNGENARRCMICVKILKGVSY